MRMSVTKLPAVLRYVWNHPLSRNHRLARVKRFLVWQIGSRIVPGAIVVPFVNGTRLLVRPGMQGATGNVYAGLQEFDEMAFVLHSLRANDLFVDVGANIGAYTLLAAGAVGCRCIAMEPVQKTFVHLGDNIRINQLQVRVEAHCLALGATTGEVRFIDSLDTMNRVASADDAEGRLTTCFVPMTTLDRLLNGRSPTIIKIDVEGYEPQVIAGAVETLHNPLLLAVILETNRDVCRGGSDLMDLDGKLRACGFQPCRYDGLSRCFQPVTALDALPANTIYARSIEALSERCRLAPRFRVLDTDV
jgi:FkbM family methyltransferase